MSLGQYESSRFSGEPVNLYFFKYGVNARDYYAYTDAEDPITFGLDSAGRPVTYMPTAIDRSKITSSGTLDRTTVTVTTPHNVDLANLYLIYPPSAVTDLIMYQGHVSDDADDYRVIWTGRVTGCARRGSRAEFTCVPISTSLKRNGLRRRYQFGCPHVLYGADCRANKATATIQVRVAALSGTRITLEDNWPDRGRAVKYQQGLAEWDNPNGAHEVRTILRSEAGGLTYLLNGTTRGLRVGQVISLVLGCNHKSGTDAQPDGDCGPLFNNILNFGGQERIPFKNPIGLVNQYY